MDKVNINDVAEIYCGDCLEVLRGFPDQSIQCCVTSPPYWGLRDYKVDGQIGVEKCLFEYITNIVCIFREVRRVLREDGTLWIVLGDSYVSSTKKKTNNAYGLKPKDMAGVPWRVAFALQDDGWYLRRDIIWSKPKVMPESVRDRCTISHEYIFHLSKSSKYYYDSDAVKEPCRSGLSDIKKMLQKKIALEASIKCLMTS